VGVIGMASVGRTSAGEPYSSQERDYVPEHEPIPIAPGRLPLVGHAVRLFRDPLTFLRSLRPVGGLVRVDIGAMPMVVITDAALTRQVLLDSRTFDKGGALFDKVRELTGDSLLTSRFEPHHRQRRLMQPAFARKRIESYATIMSGMIDAVLGQWRDEAVVDITAAMYDITARTAAHAMFAADVAGPAAARVVEALSVYLHGLFFRMMSPSSLPARIPTPANRRYDRSVRLLHESVDEIIAAYRASGLDHGDLLSMLLVGDESIHRDADDSASIKSGDSAAEEPAALSPQELHDQVITLFLAGIETTASALAWTMYLLGAHPETARALRDEADAVLGDRSPEWDDISQLTLTQRVLTEALRMYPPGWIFTRIVTQDTTLGPYRLAEGTGLAYSPYLVHHSPQMFEQPDRFDPDRWQPERMAQLPKDAFIPFGAGVHRCIGESFGLTEATLTLAAISARWIVEPLLDRPVEPAPRRATLTPGRLPMRVRRRPERLG
jgi:pentalenene oxygenase